LLGLGEIQERILAARAGFVDVAQGYWAATAPQDRLISEASAFEE
jgi:hypothetical protein